MEVMHISLLFAAHTPLSSDPHEYLPGSTEQCHTAKEGDLTLEQKIKTNGTISKLLYFIRQHDPGHCWISLLKRLGVVAGEMS